MGGEGLAWYCAMNASNCAVNAFRANSHLVWATGFMFLISWRGYWQDLIETLAWAHERTPLANLIRWRDKPVALSIVQARLKRSTFSGCSN
ncbi:Photosystem I PsaA/PsaB [Cynara cardunculus var. scolymus]|uniref:Photosystem I PsaA/PsaB n=1 Tax=Cynara cardunculus var. scolymus TaxID=59895 RepID=A0A103XS31_CYNCS|nr:Photosystem I PsaA/PsaB [Cynara cardunculus var. scolymus]